MKLAFAVIAIGSFLAIAVFGVFAMNHGEHGYSGCIAATANGAPCPEENAFASIAFHLNAFKSFSTATIINFALGLLSIMLLLALWFRNAFPARASSEQSFSARQFLERPHTPLGEQFIHWLALHENSPSVI